jgi:hypothetical protein
MLHRSTRKFVTHEYNKQIGDSLLNVRTDGRNMGTNGYPKPIEYGTAGGNIEINWDDSGKVTVIMPPNAKGYVFKRC